MPKWGKVFIGVGQKQTKWGKNYVNFGRVFTQILLISSSIMCTYHCIMRNIKRILLVPAAF